MRFMAENDYTKMLKEYALPKLNEYSGIVHDLFCKYIFVAVGSLDEEERQGQRRFNKVMYNKLKRGSLDALVILEGHKEKLEACLSLALSRNKLGVGQRPYAIDDLDIPCVCSEIKTLAYFLEEKEAKNYLKSQPPEAFDKTMKELDFEQILKKLDKFPKKR